MSQVLAPRRRTEVSPSVNEFIRASRSQSIQTEHVYILHVPVISTDVDIWDSVLQDFKACLRPPPTPVWWTSSTEHMQYTVENLEYIQYTPKHYGYAQYGSGYLEDMRTLMPLPIFQLELNDRCYLFDSPLVFQVERLDEELVYENKMLGIVMPFTPNCEKLREEIAADFDHLWREIVEEDNAKLDTVARDLKRTLLDITNVYQLDLS